MKLADVCGERDYDLSPVQWNKQTRYWDVHPLPWPLSSFTDRMSRTVSSQTLPLWLDSYDSSYTQGKCWRRHVTQAKGNTDKLLPINVWDWEKHDWTFLVNDFLDCNYILSRSHYSMSGQRRGQRCNVMRRTFFLRRGLSLPTFSQKKLSFSST